MGLPEISITFKQKASDAIKRSARGMVAVILQDDTIEQFLTPCTRWKDVKKDEWTEESLKVLLFGKLNDAFSVTLNVAILC